ncbi:MAG: response regulator [Chloroflexales bacterium]|nr:response regulator [Chloroflexales bacterium]
MRQQRIMVFNDTAEILSLFHDILAGEGYAISTNTYGTLELPLVQQYRPDLLIVDFPPVVREEQGWQLLQKLKMCPDTQAIPILVCTTNLRALDNNQGWLATKHILAIPKPFSIDELLAAVATQLRLRPDDAHAPPSPPLREREV